MSWRSALAVGLVVVAGCSGSRRGRRGTVPTQPALPPLPELVEMCVSKTVALPSKLDGRAWDGIARPSRKVRKMLPDMAAAAATGGYSAALSAASAIGVGVFNQVKGPPDMRVRVVADPIAHAIDPWSTATVVAHARRWRSDRGLRRVARCRVLVVMRSLDLRLDGRGCTFDCFDEPGRALAAPRIFSPRRIVDAVTCSA